MFTDPQNTRREDRPTQGALPLFFDLTNVRIGIALSLLAVLCGFGLAGAFGAFEDNIKGSVVASAEEVKSTVYEGDASAMKNTSDKFWTYV